LNNRLSAYCFPDTNLSSAQPQAALGAGEPQIKVLPKYIEPFFSQPFVLGKRKRQHEEGNKHNHLHHDDRDLAQQSDNTSKICSAIVLSVCKHVGDPLGITKSDLKKITSTEEMNTDERDLVPQVWDSQDQLPDNFEVCAFACFLWACSPCLFVLLVSDYIVFQVPV